MANVLAVAAFEVGNPVAFVVQREMRHRLANGIVS